MEKTRKTLTATPAKLKDGSWGARIAGTIAVGDVVTIITSKGKSWKARVTNVVWSKDGISRAAPESIEERGSKPTASTQAAAKRGPLASGSFQPRKMREPGPGEQMIHRDGRDAYS